MGIRRIIGGGLHECSKLFRTYSTISGTDLKRFYEHLEKFAGGQQIFIVDNTEPPPSFAGEVTVPDGGSAGEIVSVDRYPFARLNRAGRAAKGNDAGGRNGWDLLVCGADLRHSVVAKIGYPDIGAVEGYADRPYSHFVGANRGARGCL